MHYAPHEPSTMFLNKVTSMLKLGQIHLSSIPRAFFRTIDKPMYAITFYTWGRKKWLKCIKIIHTDIIIRCLMNTVYPIIFVKGR